jgi:alkyldihydroxyacetonephosphate synthase
LSHAQRQSLADALTRRLGWSRQIVRDPPRVEELELPVPRIEPPATLASLCSSEPRDRAAHTYGKSFRDVVRAMRGELNDPPDLVARPRDEADVGALLDWCSSASVAAVPYGGGSSVVGGVSCPVGPGLAGALSIDLGRLDQVLEVDPGSRAARVQAGVLGPSLEDQLRPRGLTLRHFPQSFEHSTVGGWLATRSGGHFATGPTHIDDFVESLRMCSPAGVLETRRLPSSGAGPAPDRLLLGSEGILGVITEAWLRLQDRPCFRSSASVRFADWDHAVSATREVVQAGLAPSNCRLLDRTEAAMSAGGDGIADLLLLGFESADHPVDRPMARALEICRDRGGSLPEPTTSGSSGVDVSVAARSTPTESSSGTTPGDGRSADPAATWRRAFLRAPYVRDALATASVIVETFESACTWSAFPGFHRAVTDAVHRALVEVCGTGIVTCRFTHVYPDGVAPYLSVLAPGRPGSEVSQWDEIKAAASEAIVDHGGTITHHHAVGRVHRPWYDRQRPDLFAGALRAAKASLDPAGILNPGVLIDPR